MKRKTQTPKKENVTGILKKLVKRIEEATVDIHEMKGDLKFVGLRLSKVESNTKIIKIDVEKMRQETGDLTEMTSEILAKMVTQKEFGNLSERVSVLEDR